jgi:pheromone shutdown-related protein TraB
MNQAKKEQNKPEKQFIRFVGTSHIAKQSLENVKQAFYEFSPDVVALELDSQRIKSLYSTSQAQPSFFSLIPHIGLFGALFVKVGHFIQQKLGKMVGISPGSEMKIAASLAKERQLPLLLIDRNINITMRRLSKAFTFKEGCHIFWEIISAPFMRKKRIRFDLSKVPPEKMVNKLIKEMKKAYPSLYKVLIEERNHYMKKMLDEFHNRFPEKRILVVVGEGHRSWLEKQLKQN